MEKMSTDMLVEESEVSSKLLDLLEKFTQFLSKYDKFYPVLQITRNCNSHLMYMIILSTIKEKQ